MEEQLLKEIHLTNPWLKDPAQPIIKSEDFIPRKQLGELLHPEWDKLWTILVGPRRAGKTTLGKFLSHELVKQNRFNELLYLNCDLLSVRKWLSSPLFISEAIEMLGLTRPIVFIDEVQRLESPGLLLKAIIDLQLPYKYIATGSSQLEIKSKVEEHLTGRQLTSLILPLSISEGEIESGLDQRLLYGSYPQVICSTKKEAQLAEIYKRYIQKDIVEILKLGNPDVFQTLLALLAHSNGQLTNYNQLASDCKISVSTIRNHLNILEETFVISKVTPYVGNKRSEVTKNPVYYFIDNGFRNTALRNFSSLQTRTDDGSLLESFIFQEILKFREQSYLSFDIHFWRTKGGAEVDFVVHKNRDQFIPIEVKFQNFSRPTISKGFRSFIEAYQPKHAVMVNKNLIEKVQVDGCLVHFIPLSQLSSMFDLIRENFVD